MKFVLSYLVFVTSCLSICVGSEHLTSLDESLGYKECEEFNDTTISKILSLDSVCDSWEKCAHMTEVEEEACGFGVRRVSGGKWVGTPVVKTDGPGKMYEHAFWRLYHYISKKNGRHAKITMTAPVVTMTELGDDFSEGDTVMYFRLPPAFQSAPPTPTDNLVFIQDWPEDKIVYYRALGREVEDEAVIHREFERLATALTNAGKEFWPYLAVAGGYTLPGRGPQRSEVMFVQTEGRSSGEAEETEEADEGLSFQKRDLADALTWVENKVKLSDIDLEDTMGALSWVEQERKVLQAWAEKEIQEGDPSLGEKEETLSLKKRDANLSLEKRSIDLANVLTWVEDNVELSEIDVEGAVDSFLLLNKERKIVQTWAEKEVDKAKNTDTLSLGEKEEKMSLTKREAELSLEKREMDFVDALMWVEDNVDIPDVDVDDAVGSFMMFMTWMEDNIEIPDIDLEDAVNAFMLLNKERQVLQTWTEKEIQENIPSLGEKEEKLSLKKGNKSTSKKERLGPIRCTYVGRRK